MHEIPEREAEVLNKVGEEMKRRRRGKRGREEEGGKRVKRKRRMETES